MENKIDRKRGITTVICKICSISYSKRNDSLSTWKGFCSKCRNVPNRKPKELKGPARYWLGKKRPDISEKMKNQKRVTGKNHYRYIEDRSKIKRYTGSNERRNQEYKCWRQQVHLRDKFKCRLYNHDCSGRIEVHHIIPWSESEELRYQVNNGITLCHAHHPRKRAEEKRLEPLFMELVSVSNDYFV